MKRMLALLLALTMAFALAACGGSETETPTTQPTTGTNPSEPTDPTVDNNVTPAKPDYLVPLEAHIGMKFQGKFEGLESRMPQVTWDWYKSECQYTPKMVIDNMKMQFERKPAQLQGEYGADCQVTYEVTQADEIGSVELNMIAQKLKSLYKKMDATKLTEGMYLRYDLTFAGALKTYTSEDVDFAVVKYDGVWYHVVLEGMPADSQFNAYIDF